MVVSVGDIFRAREWTLTNQKEKRRRTMAHVVRAWRASRTIRFLVLIAVLGTGAQVILSRGAGAVQGGAVRQTQIIGSDRLVSVEPLAETDGGQICVPESVAANLELIASLEQENLLSAQRQAASPLMASVRQQQSGSTGATTAASIPPRPSGAVRSEIAKRRPASTVRDPRNAFGSPPVRATSNGAVFAGENNFTRP